MIKYIPTTPKFKLILISALGGTQLALKELKQIKMLEAFAKTTSRAPEKKLSEGVQLHSFMVP